MAAMKPKLHVIRIDDVLNVFDSESGPQVRAKAERALLRGSQVTWEDGSIEWLEFYQRIDPTKQGSQIYTWDKQGDKVLADVVRVTRSRSGKTSKRKIGTRYVSL